MQSRQLMKQRWLGCHNAMRKFFFFSFCAAVCIFGYLAFKSLTTEPTKTPIQAIVREEVPAAKPEQMTSVFVTRQDIPYGAFISRRHLSKVNVPISSDASINGVTSFEGLAGTIAAEPISANQLLERAQIVAPDEAGFMAIAIRTGHRGISIPIWREGTSAAIYRPGDIVDLALIATFPDRNEFEAYQEANGKRTPAMLKDITATLLTQHARILAVGSSKKPTLDKNESGSFSSQIPMVLEIRDTDAEKVTLAAGIGKIMLLMRGANANDLASKKQHTTAEQLFPQFKNLGPTRGTTILRGSLKDVEGYPLNDNSKQEEKEESTNNEQSNSNE